MKTIFGILSAALVLCFYAFYNKFPLVYSDTGTYIDSGFKNFFPDDRPVFYGLFIRHVSLKASLMLVVFTQGLILAYSIFLLFKNFSRTKNPAAWTAASSILLTLVTGISFNVSQLIPDIFTPICFISMLLLLFGKRMNGIQLVLVSLIFVIAVIMHLSNLFTMTLFMGLVLIIFVFRRKVFSLFASKKRLLLSVTLLLSAYLIVPGTHYLYDQKFIYSNGSHVFRLNRLIEFGIVTDFLRQHCPEKHYTLCDYQDKPELEWEFLWGDNTPARQNGGWDAHKQEYNQILYDALTEKKYFLVYLRMTIENAFSQFFLFETGDATKEDADGSPRIVIQRWYHYDMHQYFSNKQNKGKLDFNFLNRMQLYIVFGSFLFLVVLFLFSQINSTEFRFMKFIFYSLLSFLFFNALVCSNLSTTAARFQSRVIWLLPLFILVFVSDKQNRKQLSSFFKSNEPGLT